MIVATHSPIFLDRRNFGNNYYIERRDTTITLRRLQTIQDLTSLQFLLLGNRLETLHLPSAIVLVEGPCDHVYLGRLIALRYPNALVSVVPCHGDGRIQAVLAMMRQMFGNIRRSPYADRVFVALDQVHARGLKEQLIGMGVDRDNVIVWEQNGIEYLYPHSLLQRKFGEHEALTMDGDVITANGIQVRKKELAEYVVAGMTGQEELPPELSMKLLDRLDRLLG